MLKRLLFSATLLAFITLMLIITVKGQQGDPLYFQSEKDTKVGGPFESTNNNSRFALTESIVKNKTLFFTDELAKFAAPDLVKFDNKYFSLFTPGVSFIGVPFYIIGQKFGIPQLSTYFVNLIFALINFYLILKISRKLGAGFYSSLLGGFLFTFGTNALAYTQTFTQHNASTAVLLVAALNAMSKRNFLSNFYLGILFGVGLLLDIPNAFILMPVIIFSLFKNIDLKKESGKIITSVKIGVVGFLLGLVPLLITFALYNKATTQSYFKIAQLIGRSDYPIDGTQLQERTKDPYGNKVPYNPRDLLNGFYILMISNQRGWFYYNPVIIFGIIGLLTAYRDKEKRSVIVLLISVIGISVISYSMFGDPWGGWSFGPRYLIPVSAVVATGIGVAISKFTKKFIFGLVLILISAYSIGVNAIGVMTTNAIPPRVEAVNLPEPIPYTYEYNLSLINKNFSSSLTYNIYLNRYIGVKGFILLYSAVLVCAMLALYLMSLKETD